MGRGRLKVKLKGKGRIRMKLKETKKVRELCDFCGFSSSSSILRYYYEQRSHEPDHKAVMSMEKELKRLRLVTRRMTCKDLDGLTFPELLLLEGHLKSVLLIVKDQKEKTKLKEDERLLKQNDAKGMGREVSVPCKSSTSSAGERQDDEGTPLSRMQREFERRKNETMLMEYERLWQFKERLNGRELDGMNSAELLLLEIEIQLGLVDLHDHKFAPAMEEKLRRSRQ
ncbi:agamous-like MADS-box protein AGL18 [Capsella rubella]|uniref:agamous-like MADS-box protein AGL18 n=1 Tax=Capsella rubella TaxID=81985 RepID=UPI000CD4FA4D|nr:agamous-like MADS-box protein AGL18 [Capsella rubella]